MPIKRILLLIAICTGQLLQAQEKWDILRCVNHAQKNNISVRQADLQARLAKLSFDQSKAGQLPTLNFSGSTGYRLGRSENPTTGVLEDNNFFNIGMQVQSGVTLFNWFSKKNTIAANRISWEAEKAQMQKVQNDIALNVAVAYLQILLVREQVNLAEIKLRQTADQLDLTRKKVNAGVLPELNASILESQQAADSSTLITVKANEQQFLLQMKALLNLDAGTPFDVVTPPVDVIPIIPLAELQPEAVYTEAMKSMPQQLVNQLRIQAAQKNTEVAKAGMYPTISAFGGLSTSYVNVKVPVYAAGPYKPTGALVNVGGTDYQVNAPTFIQTGDRHIALGTQFRNNFGQSIGIGLSVPIFNGKQARTGWERAKIGVQQAELEKERGDLQLKQDIYKAYNDATAALQKYNADQRALQLEIKSYDFASKRYAVNLLSTYDLLNSQNNLARARAQVLYSRYDYVFKMKLLEFYRGQGLKL